ncbi:MAG: hypothetical protein CR982_08150 [Candidatus Cloacimonadota bacterium]|nr:MAG: hypothetical protein CR982_08150 [Candidatus Cloacimonadota bacterium]PIE77650.1 MAG: hypothetical protein CSA15_12050 [Candidatus Delongbacteria bacterium]
MKSIIIILSALLTSLFPISLEEAWNSSGSNNGYDKYVELEEGVIYTGGLNLTDLGGFSTKIIGNGAVIDLQGETIRADEWSSSELSIYNCAITNGSVWFEGKDSEKPFGTVENVTFYNSKGYAIRIKNTGEDVVIKNCILSETRIDDGSGNSPDGINLAFSNSDANLPTIENNWSYQETQSPEDYSVHFSKL